MFFGEILLSIALGWLLCMLSTWLLFLRFGSYVDYRMLPRPKTVAVQGVAGQHAGMAAGASTPALGLQETEPIQQL